jgi:hypothetical protein
MIRSRNPKIDVDALEQTVSDELAADPRVRADHRLVRLSAAVHLRTIENTLERAEERSAARAEWPAEISGFPFRGNAALQRLVLRLVGLLFRDQHDVNAQLIRAQRESLTLVHGLLERVDELEARLEAERATARAERMARRHEPD